MQNHKMIPAALRVAFVLIASAAFAVGCAKKQGQETATAGQAQAQTAFATPEEAAAAFVGAVEKNDSGALRAMLGAGAEELMSSGDTVADQADHEWFVSSYKSRHSLDADGADKMVLSVGEDAWPLPIPIVKRDGKWYLDGASGVDEIVYRRVGRNELGAIDVCRGFVGAQQEYASQGRDGDPAGIYAMKLVSDAGLHNGLYWPTGDGEAPSPAGPFVAAAADEGYKAAEGFAGSPYHGYHYRMLFRQGPNASGGAKEYFKDGVLTEGFALVAWPAEYGVSGVQTFIVNQDGVVFQKDLGEDTAKAVQAIQSFDPDSSWTAVAPPAAAGTAAPAT
jgi:hypothetical protein